LVTLRIICGKGTFVDKMLELFSVDVHLYIPVTTRVKRYTRFVAKYVTGRRKRFRPYKVYIFLIRIAE